MNLIKKLFAPILVILLIITATPVYARYEVGKVKSFTDCSGPGVGLWVKSYIPTPDDSIEQDRKSVV